MILIDYWLIDWWWIQASGSGRRCVFKEFHSIDYYTQFQSVADQRWVVGFNRKGRRLKQTSSTSSRRRRRRRCFQFVKTAVDSPDVLPRPPTISYERLYSVLHPYHVTSKDPTWRNASTASCTLFVYSRRGQWASSETCGRISAAWLRPVWDGLDLRRRLGPISTFIRSVDEKLVERRTQNGHVMYIRWRQQLYKELKSLQR